MGFRFRLLFRKGPFHFALSKSRIGWSVGVPGVRYGIGGSGRRYISIGIPGTGVYWFRYLPSFRKGGGPLPPPTPSQPAPTPPPTAQLPPPAPRTAQQSPSNS